MVEFAAERGGKSPARAMGNLTAFMIVRNGELLLPRCLASLAGAVDEVVVLDTGSGDGTRGILERAAALRGGPPGRYTWAPRRVDSGGSSVVSSGQTSSSITCGTSSCSRPTTGW